MSLFLGIFSNSGTLLYGSEEKPTCLYLYEINYKVKHNQSLKIHSVEMLSLKSSLNVPSYETIISYTQAHLYRAVFLISMDL